MDDALTRTGAGRGQREYTLPTAATFAHMPTALDRDEDEDEDEDLNSSARRGQLYFAAIGDISTLG